MSKLPRSVYDIVVAVVADYDRMSKLLDKGNITRAQAILYTRYITAVDDALVAVCEGEDPAVYSLLRADIAARNGFENSRSKAYYLTKYSYDRRKSDTIVLIARILNLV